MTDKWAPHIDFVREKWCAGWSASDIAAALNAETHSPWPTRNAVLGKVNRMQLGTQTQHREKKPLPVRTTTIQGTQAIMRIRDRERAKARLKTKPREAKAPPTSPTLVVVEAPPAVPCTLLELRFKSCRWPLGEEHDPPVLFCNADRLDTRSYCAKHFSDSQR